MLLDLFKNVDGYMLDTPKVVHFGESNTGAATILESPNNKVENNLISHFKRKAI